jgi:hypothetical protein
MAQQHKDKPLVHIKMNARSTLTIVGISGNLTGFKVKGDVKDNSPVIKGEWNGKRSATGDQATELRLMLKCKKVPKERKKDIEADPPDGVLTITLEKGGVEKTVTQPVDYATDDEPT